MTKTISEKQYNKLAFKERLTPDEYAQMVEYEAKHFDFSEGTDDMSYHIDDDFDPELYEGPVQSEQPFDFYRTYLQN